MFKWYSMMTMSMVVIFKHPLIMIMSIILSSTVSSLMLFMMVVNQWINYILVLTFLGGMMVMFMYMASLTPNEEFLSKNKLFMWMIALSIFMTMFSIDENIYYNSYNMIYSSMWMAIMYMTAIISTILVYIMLIIYEPFNPLKAKN